MKIDIKHIAKLANIPISTSETKKLEKELSETISYVEKINSINTEGIEPTYEVTGLENVTREDKAEPSLPQDKALLNAKSQHNGLFKVKAILE